MKNYGGNILGKGKCKCPKELGFVTEEEGGSMGVTGEKNGEKGMLKVFVSVLSVTRKQWEDVSRSMQGCAHSCKCPFWSWRLECV